MFTALSFINEYVRKLSELLQWGGPNILELPPHITHWLVGCYQLIAKAVGVFRNPNHWNPNRTTSSTTNQQKPPLANWQVMRLLGLWSRRLMKKTIFQAVFWFQVGSDEEDIFRAPKSQSAKKMEGILGVMGHRRSNSISQVFYSFSKNIELKTLETKNGEEFQSWNFPLWNQLQISTKKPPPPTQFFLVHPLRFSLKKHDA